MTTQPASPRRFRLGRMLLRGIQAIAAFVLFYGAFVLLGYVPVNSGYAPPPDDDRVVIFIRSNAIHTDLVLPVVSEDCDWRETFRPAKFQDDIRTASHIAIGWGDRGFYMETPEWKDLKAWTLFNAVFLPSVSVVHAEYLPAAGADEWTREIPISRENYRVLIKHIRDTIRPAAGSELPISAGDYTYGRRDHFFQARGSYHLFNTCNQWTGRGLKKAGVPTGLWTPLKGQVMRCLPRADEPQ